MPIYTNLPIEKPTAPMAYPAVHPDHNVLGRGNGAIAIGVGSAIAGAVVGAGVMATRKLSSDAEKDQGKE